jgi:hypothetical protein
MRLPQPGGPGSLFISPRKKVAQLYPPGTGSEKVLLFIYKQVLRNSHLQTVLYGPSWNPEMNFSLDTLCVTFG